MRCAVIVSLHYVGYAVATDSRVGGAAALLADLAREALFWHIQQELTKNNAKDGSGV